MKSYNMYVSAFTAELIFRILGWAAFRWLSKHKSSRKPGANPHVRPGGWRGKDAAGGAAGVRKNKLQRKLPMQQVSGERRGTAWVSWLLQESAAITSSFCFPTARWEHRHPSSCGEAQTETALRYHSSEQNLHPEYTRLCLCFSCLPNWLWRRLFFSQMKISKSGGVKSRIWWKRMLNGSGTGPADPRTTHQSMERSSL